jgi:magnesium-transporting ATPase (P-type)
LFVENSTRHYIQVEIFQEYGDTVIAIGVSHLPWNVGIFSTSDISVGIDVLTETFDKSTLTAWRATEGKPMSTSVLPSELEFVCAIASHSCAFRLRGASSLSQLPAIIQQGRASLEAAIAAGIFLVMGSISFSFYVLFSVCAPSSWIPFVPTLGAVVYLQIVLPGIGLVMAMSDSDDDTMKHVPAKNDQAFAFGRTEGWRLYSTTVYRAILPALLPQFLQLIAFGELIIHMEPDLVASECSGAKNWVDVIRCDGLKDYSGPASTSSGTLVFAEFAICIILGSMSFVRRFNTIVEEPPWDRNHAMAWATFVALALVILYAFLNTANSTGSALPWYFYALAVILPFVCLAWNEYWKQVETRHQRRSEKLRRLQFETRLGAWSPK